MDIRCKEFRDSFTVVDDVELNEGENIEEELVDE